MKVKVEIFLKAGVLDVQGKAIEAALHGLDFKTASEVRVGRVVTLDVAAADASAAEAEARRMADLLLANQVIETYRVEVLA